MKAKPRGNTQQKPDVRKGEVVEIALSSLDDEGYGIGACGDRRIRILGGLPGERLLARIDHAGMRTVTGHATKILAPSPDRIDQIPCKHWPACDACSLLHQAYPAQLAWKQRLVANQLRRHGELAQVVIRDILPSPSQLAYRNSAKLVVGGKAANPVIGIYRRNSHDVLDLADCPLHHPLINRIVAAVKEGIRKGKVQVYNPASEMGLLRYLVVRVAEAEERAMVVFVTSQRNFNEIHHLGRFVQQAVPEVRSIWQNVNASAGNVIFGHQSHLVAGDKTLTTTLDSRRYHLSPRSFFQVNSGGASLIYQQVRSWGALTGRENVIDCYCGIGGIALTVAKEAGSVLGLEVVDAAVADARENARLNGIRNCSFEAGDVGELLADLREEGAHIDLLILNPPRKGCEEQVLNEVARLKPLRVIYVSCSPATLARDLAWLARNGYRPLEVQPVDMFPQTGHVENVALLQRERSPA
jgi:23S rRNA (uracil1939-C5)-methyltransferase